MSITQIHELARRMAARAAALMGSAACVAACGFAPTEANADLHIRTELPETTLIAGREEPYQMIVTVNSLEHPGVQFSSSGWDINVPPYIDVVGATLPDGTLEFPINCVDGPSGNDNDCFSPQADPFFHGIRFAAFNCVTSTVDENDELFMNIRNVSGMTGPSDRDFSNGLLGIYYFRVNEGTPPQSGSFDMNQVAFYGVGVGGFHDMCSLDTRCCETPNCCEVHPDWCEGLNLITISNDTFTIVPPATAYVLIETEIPHTNPGCEGVPDGEPCELVADGATQYHMNVRANTTEYPGIGFNLAEWEVIVPDYVTIIGAELPPPGDSPPTNPEDFFNGFPMGDNIVDQDPNDPVPGEGVLYNARYTTGTGHSDITFSDGLLGTYFFTVNLGAEGNGNFDFVMGHSSSLHFKDEFETDYRDPCTWDGGGNAYCCNNDCCVVHPDWCEGYGLVDKTNDTFTIVECFTNSDCDDNEVCSGTETCSGGECISGEPLSCDNGLFCDGQETCTPGVGCEAGTPPETDDGIPCTVDSCDEDNDTILHVPDDALCDNGDFCDGAEICNPATGCEAGTPPDTDDGIACTADSCDEDTDTILHIPDDALCDNGAFCDGAETCDPTVGCEPGTPPDTDDGIACTADSCDEDNDTILHVPDDALCDNEAFCDGAETCDVAAGCVAGDPPIVDDGIPCTTDSCDEDSDTILHIPDDQLCDNGAFCDGAEICNPAVGCEDGTPPETDDGIPCTMDSCDEGNDTILHVPNDQLCDNKAFCDGAEFCNPAVGCEDGELPDIDDGVECTADSCDEDNDTILHEPNDEFCNNGAFCDGAESCDVDLGCVDGDPPDTDDGIPCTVDSCDEDNDTIVHLPDDLLCDNGAFCDGTETCDVVAGCVDGAPPCEEGTCDEKADDCFLCPADFNNDQIVDAADLAQLLGSWGACEGCPADLDGDGDVDAADLAQLLGSWGSCEP